MALGLTHIYTSSALSTAPAAAVLQDLDADAAGWAAEQAQAARAFEIADQQMFVALESYGIKGDEHGTVFGLCNPTDGEVSSLAEAGEELSEAVGWLVSRGYVELASDENGEHVIVLRRPGDGS
jgi:hypothetical protein